jgi:hypothetical protein
MKFGSALEPQRPRAELAAALALGLALGSGGCSFYWAKPPPPRSTWPDPVLPSSSEERCTVSLGPPILDTVGGVAFGTLGFIERNAVRFGPNPDGHGFPAVEDARGIGHFQPPASPALVPVPDYLSRGLALTFGLGSLTALASAVYGYVEASRCRRYQALFHP